MQYITQLRAEDGSLNQYSDFGVTWTLNGATIARDKGRFGKDAISIGSLKYLYSTPPQILDQMILL